MKFTFMASRYGNSALEKQLCQRAAHPSDDEGWLPTTVEDHAWEFERGRLEDLNLKSENRRRYLKRCRNSSAKELSEKIGRRKFDPELETVDEEMTPQFGLDTFSLATFSIEALARYTNLDIPDILMREFEGFALLFTSITQQTTPLGVITTLLMWVRSRTDKSLFSVIKSFIETELVAPQSSVAPEWLDCIRDARSNWQLCKSNKAFKQISRVLGCIVTLGLCDASKLTFDINGFKVFEPDMSLKHLNAFDLFDAVFETVVYFVEGGYLCFQSGSLRPLLVNDRSAMELDQEYAQVTAWFQLVKNGNLKKLEDMTDQEFEKRLNRLSTALLNISHSLKGFDKKLVMDKFEKVLEMQNDYTTIKISSGIRHAPWAIEAFGESSQGKTTFIDQLLDAVMASQNMPIDKEFRCAYNPGDKFMSNWTTDKLVMIFDDISNAKSQFVEKPPTAALIDVINNQMYYAPKAELNAKGKCFVEPWIAVATTNTKSMDAGSYSNCPFSAQRRLTCITVRAKIEFQKVVDGICCGIDPKKVRDFYTVDGEYRPPQFDDIWVLTIEQAVKPKNLRDVATYKPITWRGKLMVDISMETCVQWAIDDFAEHKKNQEAIMESYRARSRNIELCPREGCCHIAGMCPDHPMQPHMGPQTLSVARRLLLKSDPRFTIDRLLDRADGDVAEALYNSGTRFLKRWNWICIVPTSYLANRRFRQLMEWLYKDKIETDVQTRISAKKWRLFITSVLMFLFLPISIALFLFCCNVIVCLFSMNALVETVKNELHEDLANSNIAIAPVLRKVRDKYGEVITGSCVLIAIIYGLAKNYREAYGRNMTTQGTLEPLTKQEVERRDAADTPWTQVVKRSLPISDKSKRMSPDQLANVISKNLVHCRCTAGEEFGLMNCLMITSNIVVIPNHYFEAFGDTLECTFRKKNPTASGGKFAARIHISLTHHIPDTDLRLCYIASGGSFKNIVEYFPKGWMPSVPFSLFFREVNGTLLRGDGLTAPQRVTTDVSFEGGIYKNLTLATFGGMCGAPVISNTNGTTILGVHLGGIDGTNVGCYGSMTQNQLTFGIDKIRSMTSVVVTGAEGNFRETILNTQMLKSEPLHKKSPLNFLPHDSQIEYYGSCIGRSVAKSDVRVTPISEHIIDVCNVPNIYGPPKMNPDWFGYQKCLENLAVPAHPFEPPLLVRAVEDYTEPLRPIFRSELWNGIRPLTDEENICGVPGVKFLDAIKLDTSIGYPLGGPKRDHVLELEPTEEYPHRHVFTPEIMEEISTLEKCYARGERGYPIAKACKKDEILSKEKCRIFYGNAISLTFLIRKYFLPVLRVLQMNPLVSECAVGINSHGPEWQEFYTHATKFGLDRLFGGDYGKYDQKLPSQVILAALSILISLAADCQYSPEDLRIMQAMCGDIVYSYIAFNGDLIGLTEGTHISGNSLTVIINGICGSLNLRAYFYSRFDTHLRFRDCVATMTYGDDNIGSVASGFEDFNIKNLSHFLGRYGQTYTMPDKESELVPFLKRDEFEFLKRTSVYHPKLGCHVGALVDKSIFKSLHCFMRPKNCVNTKEYACALNIDTALREWFNHGEDVYEMRRSQMQEVAQRAEITHLCTQLDETYDDKVAEWKDKYC